MNKKTIRDIDVAGKRVLVRVDFNVPLDKATLAILDDTRIRAALPTIRYLREQHAKTMLVSHLGRPDGKVVESARLAPVAARLARAARRRRCRARPTSSGLSAEATVAAMQPGDVAMLENVRFEPGEEKNDPALAQKLAAFADVYVNDAFGTAHRAHASTAGVAAYLPAVAGFLMEKEIDYLGRDRQQSGAAGRGDHRRCQDQLEDRRAAAPAVEGERAADRRRHGEHVPQGAGHRRRRSSLVEDDQLATAQRDHRRRRAPRREARPAHRRRHRRQVRGRCRDEDGRRRTTCPKAG